MAEYGLEGLGFIADVLGTIGFFGADVTGGGGSKAGGTTFRVCAGLGPAGANPYAGSIHAIYAYDSNNQYLGVSDLDISIGNPGEFVDIMVHQTDADTVQAKYVNLINGDDDTCIAYITMTEPDGALQKTWFGDNGRNCGQAWFASMIESVGMATDGSNTLFSPACTFFDDNGDDGSLSQQMKADMFALSGDGFKYDPNQDYCSYTVWGNGVAPNGGSVAKRSPSEEPTKRKLKPRSEAHSQTLIISNMTSHTGMANSLCSSETSRGPDFIDVNNGIYCDMGAKTMAPLCTDANAEDCFDLENKILRTRPLHGASLQARALPTHYKWVEHW